MYFNDLAAILLMGGVGFLETNLPGPKRFRALFDIAFFSGYTVITNFKLLVFHSITSDSFPFSSCRITVAPANVTAFTGNPLIIVTPNPLKNTFHPSVL